MTSSLVGSEMCIRDSPSCGCTSGVPVQAVRLSRGPRLCALHLLWPGAVSYTHLTLPTICSV
eukprot:11300826-Prorocentrum_lima.AAC.1